jgi:hypothetical protein
MATVTARQALASQLAGRPLMLFSKTACVVTRMADPRLGRELAERLLFYVSRATTGGVLGGSKAAENR